MICVLAVPGMSLAEVIKYMPDGRGFPLTPILKKMSEGSPVSLTVTEAASKPYTEEENVNVQITTWRPSWLQGRCSRPYLAIEGRCSRPYSAIEGRCSRPYLATGPLQ